MYNAAVRGAVFSDPLDGEVGIVASFSHYSTHPTKLETPTSPEEEEGLVALGYNRAFNDAVAVAGLKDATQQ
jgi:hypothetical protein